MKFFYFLYLVILLSCNNATDSTEKNIKNSATDKLETTINKEISLTGKVKQHIDCLEKLFNNNNYLLKINYDSTYVYFTRLNDNTMYTHTYKLAKGDSTQLKIDTIQGNTDQIIWNWRNQSYTLDSATNNYASWIHSNNNKIIFIKNEKGQITLKNDDDKSIVLTKLPQISLFLARSFYDYKNGTHFAFDTSNFTKK